MHGLPEHCSVATASLFLSVCKFINCVSYRHLANQLMAMHCHKELQATILRLQQLP